MSVTASPRLSLADLGRGTAHAPVTAPVVNAAPARQQSPGFRRGAAAAEQAEPFRKATDPQVRYLKSLVAERAPQTDPAYTQSVIDGGFYAVSRGIEKLKALPKVAAVGVPAPRTNQYPGTCENCGTRVGAEEGTVAKADNGKWEVEHLPGHCPVSEFPFPVGRYAAVSGDEIHFFHATHDGLFEQAGDTLYPVHGIYGEAMIGQISLDPYVASTTYGTEIGKCGRCGRSLTDKTSRAAGIGPVCAGKGWS